MDLAQPLLAALDLAMRETALFAAAGFLLLGFSDLLVDSIWLASTGWRRLTRGGEAKSLDDLPRALEPGMLAVFIPAWDEAAVIRAMLRHTLATFEHEDYRLYVGCYPNDPDTLAEVMKVEDPRVRPVVGTVPGPTTKADCLNRLWEAMLQDEVVERRRVKAIVLHDAEDVVDPAELRVLDSLIERYDLVQLPVVPLIDPNSRWVAGHYADEFAESHGKEMVVRALLGTGIPSAGVGCAFSRQALAGIAEQNGGAPFQPDSLTEDYELGLRLRDAGGTRAFVRIAGRSGTVATREYFPSTLGAAVRQKARWMTGIALSGWDRLGWNGGLAERWMRLRDRQSVLAALLLLSGYSSLALWVLLKLPELAVGWRPAPIPSSLAVLLQVNLAMLAWRLAMRFAFVTRVYGVREGLRAIPRMVVSNLVTMLAAARAVANYRVLRKGGMTRWDKTVHAFPAQPATG